MSAAGPRVDALHRAAAELWAYGWYDLAETVSKAADPPDGAVEQERELSLLLRRAARGYLGLKDGDHWPSGVADTLARAILAALAASPAPTEDDGGDR